MALAPGAKLGPYEVLGPLGAGGMGEVYRARDTRLERTVAVKVLPAEVAASPERRARFEREARAISALNHPHICVLHDVGHQDGTDYIVMELVDGETLLERLKKGPLALEQTLRYGIEIADALDKAHRHGVIHRDLKPGNVMLTKSGVKLLDFGLAKRGPSGSSAGEVSALPTQEKPLTEAGSLLGTYQYMAPEQLEGGEADARADIWALGCVLYEMATGRRAFEGKSQASLISAILKDEPQPIAKLQPTAPPALDRLVKVCLAKDPDNRLQTAHDVMQELKWIAEGSSQTDVAPALPATRALRRTWTLALVAAAVAGAALLGWHARRVPASDSGRVARFALNLPRAASLPSPTQLLALSPDGRWLAFAPGNAPLFVRPMDGLEFRALPGTEGAYSPFFSPDGEWVGFATAGSLKKVSLSGGPPVSLCESQAMSGAAWGADGTIWYSPNSRSALWRVSAEGGEPVAATRLDVGRGEISHRFPELLPGGKALLFTVKTADITSFDEARIDAVDLATGRRRTVLEGGYHARYTGSGHLVFVRDRSLLAASFDPDRLVVTGPTTQVGDEILADPSTAVAQFDFSADGLLAYFHGKARMPENHLVWVDRRGAEEPIRAPLRAYVAVRVSPDGRHLALGVTAANDDIWTLDLGRGALTRLSHSGGNNNNPVWTPDGRRVAFGAEREGPWNVFSRLADGSSGEERLTKHPTLQVPTSFSPDGRSLVFMQVSPKTKGDIWLVSLDGEHPAQPLLETPFDEGQPMISPDGRWMAYTSDESGRAEVYVRPFPGPGERWQVSTDGGTEPMWARNGRELFLRLGDVFMSAGVEPQGRAFRTAVPRRLFEGRYLRDFEVFPTATPAVYDVSPDGRRFVVIKSAEKAPPPSQLQVVIHWFDELNRRVAVGGVKSP